METIQYDWDGFEITDNCGYIETNQHNVIMVSDNYLDYLYQYLFQHGYRDDIHQRKEVLDVFDEVINLFDDAIGIAHFHISNPYQYPSFINDSTIVDYQTFKKINNQT